MINRVWTNKGHIFCIRFVFAAGYFTPNTPWCYLHTLMTSKLCCELPQLSWTCLNGWGINVQQPFDAHGSEKHRSWIIIRYICTYINVNTINALMYREELDVICLLFVPELKAMSSVKFQSSVQIMTNAIQYNQLLQIYQHPLSGTMVMRHKAKAA